MKNIIKIESIKPRIINYKVVCISNENKKIKVKIPRWMVCGRISCEHEWNFIIDRVFSEEKLIKSETILKSSVLKILSYLKEEGVKERVLREYVTRKNKCHFIPKDDRNTKTKKVCPEVKINHEKAYEAAKAKAEINFSIGEKAIGGVG